MSNAIFRTGAERLYGEYYSRVRTLTPDFADDLLREALRCYSIEAHAAVCITCRVVVEEELKEIYEILVNLGHQSTQRPVEQMELEPLKQWAHRLGIIDAAQFGTIGDIQRRGNRSAHGPTADIADHWNRRLAKKKEKEDLAEPLEIWADRSDALGQITATSKMLHDLKIKKHEIKSRGLSAIKPRRGRIPGESLSHGAELAYRNSQQFMQDGWESVFG